MRRLFDFSIPLHRPAVILTLLSVLLTALTPGVLTAQEVPVVVAIDTSRSLSPSELASTVSKVGDILSGLSSDTPVGLLAFDDTPQWLVGPSGTKEAVMGALADLNPAGNFTLLNDALFSAARELPDGGVILLLTDGRDENSATTVEDVAGICRTHNIRIVAVGTGRRVDDLALRRLALLTDGAHLDHTATVDPAMVTTVVAEAAQTTSLEVESAREAQTAVITVEGPSAAAPPLSVPTGPEINPTPWWLLPLLLVLIIAVLAALVILWRMRRSDVVQPDLRETGDWETDPSINVISPSGDAAHAPTVELGTAPPMEERADELVLDPSAFERLPFDGDLDTTSVLDEQHIVSVMEPGKEVRSFRLRPDRAFAVGRAPGVNTLTLSSRALSGQHFKIVPHEGGFAVVDLDSTNGTLVKGRRIRAHHLEAGDIIQAGEVEFEFKVILKSLM